MTVACPDSLQCQLPCHFYSDLSACTLFQIQGSIDFNWRMSIKNIKADRKNLYIFVSVEILKIHLDLMASLGVRVRGWELGHALVCLCSL